MKILGAEEIRLWDQYTIEQEPISSIELMERAASRCVEWLSERFRPRTRYQIFCGKGNNGGDGLAIARMLAQLGHGVAVSILEFGHKGTSDFQSNLARLHQQENVEIRFIQSEENFQQLEHSTIVIDALFGSGLNRRLEGVTAKLVEHINRSGCQVLAIDIPSGMFVDHTSVGNTIIKANYTLSFQCLKPAFLVAENAAFVGEVHVLDIGLLNEFLGTISPVFDWVDQEHVASIYKPRDRFAHKGNFGHGLMIAGSYGKMGAAVLSARACLRSGIGLLTCHLPGCGYGIMQTAVPEAMVMTDFNSSFATKIDADLTKFSAVGIGPGIGTASETKMLIREVLDLYRHPLVIDADALNIIGTQKDLKKLIPPGSILTPHPKEFQRLFGESPSDLDAIQLALHKAKQLHIVIVLKGHHSFIATPDGKGFFNSTGNPGMATGGSGDVLTGVLTALIAQGYGSVEAAILGTYLHGLAGDLAAEKLSPEAMIASDIVDNLPDAFGAITA